MNKIVWIVDDDDDDRALFADALKVIGNSYTCVSVGDGQRALELLKDVKTTLPDLIFLDLNMPRLNGKECLAEIKKIPHVSHIPVIMYSTTKRMEDVEETKKLGAAYFLTKPALFNDICDAIRLILETKWGNDSTL